MNDAKQENQTTQHHGAHSNSRSGLSDYNDGSIFTHYLGNDDQEKNPKDDESEFDGQVALGNGVPEEKSDKKQ